MQVFEIDFEFIFFCLYILIIVYTFFVQYFYLTIKRISNWYNSTD